jgi:hypothetical protein
MLTPGAPLHMAEAASADKTSPAMPAKAVCAARPVPIGPNGRIATSTGTFL